MGRMEPAAARDAGKWRSGCFHRRVDEAGEKEGCRSSDIGTHRPAGNTQCALIGRESHHGHDASALRCAARRGVR